MGGTGPIPIRTPVIPVQIPVVPDKPGVLNGSRSGEQTEGRGGAGGGGSPESPTYVGGGEADLLPMASWSGQASTNPPAALQQQQHYVSEAAAGREGPGEQGLAEDAAEGNMLLAIRKGVKLKRTLTNDRSAPRIA